MSNQSGLFHNACSICEQYEKAVINYARLVVDAPTTSLLEDSKSIFRRNTYDMDRTSH